MLKEIEGNLWDYHKKGYTIAITTNGTIRNNGSNVMGAGTAGQASSRYPSLPRVLGDLIRSSGNHVLYLSDFRMVSFPTKYNWWCHASTYLIEESCQELMDLLDAGVLEGPIILPRPGVGAGKLSWSRVKPILEKYLDDRIWIISNPELGKPVVTKGHTSQQINY